MILLKTSVAALAALTVTCGAAAVAGPYPEHAMVVRLQGLNVGSEVGAHTALRRIQNAANAYCGWTGPRDIARTRLQQACVAGMTDAAVKALDAPRVTALHDTTPRILLARRDR